MVILVAMGLVTTKAWAETEEEKKAREEVIKKQAEKNELFDKEFMEMYKDGQRKFLAGQYDQVIGVAQNLLRKRRSGRATVLMATAYKAKALYPRAIELFQQAASLFDDKSEFYEKAQALYNVAFCYELAKNRTAAISSWQLYINFASNYPQEANSVAFARGRINTLNSVKAPAPTTEP
jgi:tetratricopeptide (TPR) repeat protein